LGEHRSILVRKNNCVNWLEDLEEDDERFCIVWRIFFIYLSFFFFFFDRFLLFEAAAALDCSRIHTHTHTRGGLRSACVRARLRWLLGALACTFRCARFVWCVWSVVGFPSTEMSVGWKPVIYFNTKKRTRKRKTFVAYKSDSPYSAVEKDM